MPLIKTSDLDALSHDERVARLEEFRKELLHERGVAAMGGAPTNPGRIRALRKSIARILTYEAQLAAEEVSKEEK